MNALVAAIAGGLPGLIAAGIAWMRAQGAHQRLNAQQAAGNPAAILAEIGAKWLEQQLLSGTAAPARPGPPA